MDPISSGQMMSYSKKSLVGLWKQSEGILLI